MPRAEFVKFEAYKIASMAVHAAAYVWDGRTWVGPMVAAELRKIGDNLDALAEGLRKQHHEGQDK